MTKLRSDLADWLRAVDGLSPQTEEGFEAISRLLGLRLRAPEKKTDAPLRKRVKTAEPAVATAPPVTPQPAAPEKPRRRIESVLAAANSTSNAAPQWLAAAHHLETPKAAHIRPLMPLEPLFPARTSRAILSGALATPSANGPLDLPKVIEMLSRAQVIERLPRSSIPTLVRGVQLLIDSGESMQPFAADQAELLGVLSRVVGRDRTAVLYFDGSPLWGAGAGPKDTWSNYQAPAAGTPVVVLTDLGIAQPRGVGGLAGPSDWRAFANVLGRAGCPLLALVPYPQRRWPALSKSMTIVQWDRATTAATVRQSLRGANTRVTS